MSDDGLASRHVRPQISALPCGRQDQALGSPVDAVPPLHRRDRRRPCRAPAGLQAVDRFRVVAVHLVAHRLPVHANDSRRLLLRFALEHAGDRQNATDLHTVGKSERFPSQLRHTMLRPRHLNRQTHPNPKQPIAPLSTESETRPRSNPNQRVSLVQRWYKFETGGWSPRKENTL